MFGVYFLNYLSDYRMINDYIDIESGEVIDLSLQIDLHIDKNATPTDIVRSVISGTTDFFAIEKIKMGDPLFVGDLKREIGNVAGVVNVIDVRLFNLIGGKYSSAEVAQSYVDENTKEILNHFVSELSYCSDRMNVARLQRCHGIFQHFISKP